MALQTEFEFILPQGYVDTDGKIEEGNEHIAKSVYPVVSSDSIYEYNQFHSRYQPENHT